MADVIEKVVQRAIFAAYLFAGERLPFIAFSHVAISL
jgi:hypothetical protein